MNDLANRSEKISRETFLREGLPVSVGLTARAQYLRQHLIPLLKIREFIRDAALAINMLPVWRDGEEESSDVERIVDLTGDAEDEPFHSGASAATTTNFKLKSLITPTASVDSNVQGNPSNPEVSFYPTAGTQLWPMVGSEVFNHSLGA